MLGTKPAWHFIPFPGNVLSTVNNACVEAKVYSQKKQFAGLSATRGNYIAMAATMSVTRDTASAVGEHLFGAPYLQAWVTQDPDYVNNQTKLMQTKIIGLFWRRCLWKGDQIPEEY